MVCGSRTTPARTVVTILADGASHRRGAPAREARCEWLHVDFEDDLRSFYFDACGFISTNAGLLRL